MKRYLAVLVLVAVGSGCVALQRTPDATVLQSVWTIAVIPVESAGPATGNPPPRPLLGSGPGAEVLKAGAMTPVGLPVVTGYAIYRLADEASKLAAIPDEPLTVERDLPASRGVLTVDLAKTAVEILQQRETRSVYLADGYLRLPRVDPQYPGEVMDERNTRIKRWYNQDLATIDYSGLKHEGLDASLEIGTLGFWAVMRLVDPTTKQVLGRARNMIPMFAGRRVQPPEQWDEAVRREMLTQCLKDLGLLAE